MRVVPAAARFVRTSAGINSERSISDVSERFIKRSIIIFIRYLDSQGSANDADPCDKLLPAARSVDG
jgi:hypothetical protein